MNTTPGVGLIALIVQARRSASLYVSRCKSTAASFPNTGYILAAKLAPLLPAIAGEQKCQPIGQVSVALGVIAESGGEPVGIDAA